MERLTDLDELILRCRSDSAKSYASEAVASYRAGAYRSSIVTAWIALVSDIIEKIRDLDLAGDLQAKALVAELDGYKSRLDRGDKSAIGLALKIEREILEIARDKFALLDHQQFTDLDRLREDRNRCAHPSLQYLEEQYQPSGELARLHLRNLVVHLLSQPPIQGKAALDRLRNSITSKYFPTDFQKAKQTLQDAGLQRPTPSLVRALVDNLLFGFFEKDDGLHNLQATLTALKATLDLHRVDAEPRLTTQIRKIAQKVDDDDFPRLIALCGVLPECWQMLPDGKCEELRLFVKDGPSGEVSRIIAHTLNIQDLKETAAARLEQANLQFLTSSLESTTRRKSDPDRSIIAGAVNLYRHAGSWEAANSVAEKLVLPIFQHLSSGDIKSIIRAPSETGADLRGSHGFARFIDQVRADAKIPEDELNELLVECGLNAYVKNGPANEEDDEIPF